MITKKIKITFFIFTFVYLLGFIPQEQHLNPVVGASPSSWNAKSFWYYPWGSSGTHKGIDIFADEGTPVVACTDSFVLYSGTYGKGGQVIYALSANWHFHYYAHLQHRDVTSLMFVKSGQQIGAVGTTGNAKGKPAHLHYSISTLLPRLWKYDPRLPSSWKRLFYIDPGAFITQGNK